MRQKLLLGIDMGTGGCKTTVINTQGAFLANGYCDYPSYHPYVGWTEQKADDWFPSLIKSLQNCYSKGNINPKDIIGVCVDGSAHNAVLLDKEFNVIRNTIMWADQRSINEAKYLREYYADNIFRITYQLPTPTWTLPQLMWIKNNEPNIFSSINKIMFIKDYIRFLLTGCWVTDFIEAQGSLLFDNNLKSWSKDLCKIGGIDIEFLPPIVSPEKIVGNITERSASLTGLNSGVPVIAGTTDTALEIYCVGANSINDCVIKIASAGCVNFITDTPSPDVRGLTYSHIINGLWYTVFATNSAAFSLRWFKDMVFSGLLDEKMESEKVYELINREAEQSKAGCEGLIFHPYLMGERSPYWNESLRGSFIGLSTHHSRGHFFRSIMEGVAFSIKNNFNIADKRSKINRVKVLGGGMNSELWKQILADVIDMPLVKYKFDDSSFGGAILTGVGIGVFDNHSNAIEKCVKISENIIPDPCSVEVYKKAFMNFINIHKQLEDIYLSLF